MEIGAKIEIGHFFSIYCVSASGSEVGGPVIMVSLAGNGLKNANH